MYLFIDTSSEISAIGLLNQQGSFVDKIEWIGGFNQSEELLPNIDRLLSSRTISKSDLNGIIVVSGPGSYTGGRVGVATVNALALVLNIKLQAVEKSDKYDWETIINNFDNIGIGSIATPVYTNPPYITKSRADRQRTN